MKSLGISLESAKGNRPLVFATAVGVFIVAFAAIAPAAFATTFIVPVDEELIEKSGAIVTGVITSARAVEGERGYAETFYEVAVDRVLKGPLRAKSVVTINSPGGSTEERFTVVHSAAHFAIGDAVLLFLVRHHGGWTPTDLTLGKFRFLTTSKGYGVAVRDADDVVGWDRDGKAHREKLRLEPEFLAFIADRVAGRKANPNYQVATDDFSATASDKGRPQVPDLFDAPATTYSLSMLKCDLQRFPGRWDTLRMNAGIPFFKNAAQNAAGLGDGGIILIQSALGAWTNDCGSAVNISYGGTRSEVKADDGFNMIVFNDPNGDIAESWNGTGAIAVTFSVGFGTHTFDGVEFVNLLDSDTVFQDGFPGNHPFMEEALTHEIGHSIGFRHADKHYIPSCTAPVCEITCTETACDPAVEECSSAAVMTASLSSSTNDFALQPWDQHAAGKLYPATCTPVNPPTNVIATAASSSVVNISWTAAAGVASYNVYRSIDAVNYAFVGNTTFTSFSDMGRSANVAYLYKVRSVNGGESNDSNKDLATTVIFTDDPLIVGTTAVMATHMTQLRTAVDAVRALAGIGAGSYLDPTLTAAVTTIKRAHIMDLRAALDEARSSLTLPAIVYGESLTAAVTPVKAAHINELRNGVK